MTVWVTQQNKQVLKNALSPGLVQLINDQNGAVYMLVYVCAFARVTCSIRSLVPSIFCSHSNSTRSNIDPVDADADADAGPDPRWIGTAVWQATMWCSGAFIS